MICHVPYGTWFASIFTKEKAEPFLRLDLLSLTKNSKLKKLNPIDKKLLLSQFCFLILRPCSGRVFDLLIELTLWLPSDDKFVADLAGALRFI